MNWLIRLLGIEAPPDTTLVWPPEISPRGSFPWWAAALLFVASSVGVGYLYALERASKGVVRRILMAGLRMMGIALLLFLLVRPVLIAQFQGQRPQPIAVLIDNSQSLKLQDRRVSVADRLRVAIATGAIPADSNVQDLGLLTSVSADLPTNPDRAQLVEAVLSHEQLKLLAGLKSRGPLRTFLFGQRLRNIADDKGPGPAASGIRERLGEAFKADETRTGLADAISEVLQRKDGDLPAAIVLVTDGRDNASKVPLDEAARECARLQVPLHIYGVGSSEGGILQLKDVGIPETIFYDDTVSIPVRWRSQGLKRGAVVVTATLGGQEVARREIPVREGDDLREVLTFTPEKRGKERDEKTNLVVTVRMKDDDNYKDTSRREVQVLDRKVRVLYIENSPRWEYKFLQPALLRDRRVDASFLLVNADPRTLQAGPPFLTGFPARDKLFAFDLLILGDVPSSYLGREHLEWIQDFVKEGGGLVVIAGRQHLPSSYDTTSLAEVLPVEFIPVKFKIEADARPQAFSPMLTRHGERSEMLALADTPEENQRTWKQLPGIYWHYPVTKLRPGATALLTHPRAKAGEQPMPLAATHYYGKGQVLFLGLEETWRWRYNVQDRYFARFWGQVIYQMGLPHLLGNARRVQLGLERSEAIFGRPSYLYARLFDNEFRPLKEQRVLANLEYLDARKGEPRLTPIILEAIAGMPGEYRAALPNDAAGRFEVRLTTPEPAALQFRVNYPPRHELEVAGMAEEPLREAARLSGGKFYREEDLHRLVRDVEPRKAAFTHRQEVLLWGPLAFLLFVGVVTVEWVARKFSNLS